MKNEIIMTPKNGVGLIHNWGSKKRKNDSRTFVGYFLNNICLKQIYVWKIE
jgi:hypothetical protein